jgi:hypothetical protein
MNVDLGLLGYLPLPQMPFDKVNPAPTEKKRIIEETHKSVDRKADAFRYESIYAYHPHNMNKIPQGQLVDFVVA